MFNLENWRRKRSHRNEQGFQLDVSRESLAPIFVAERAIDVSRYETNPWDYSLNPASFANAANQGVTTIIPKVSQGTNVDPSAWYWQHARMFKRGGFHFWNVTDTVNAARVFVLTWAAFGFTDLAPVVDFEPPKVSTPSIPNNLRTFISEVEQLSGTAIMLYSSVSFLNYHFPNGIPDWLTSKDLWIAAWPTYRGGDRWDLSNYSYQRPALPRGWTYAQLKMWQFTDKISIPGYAGNVDGDYYFPNGYPYP